MNRNQLKFLGRLIAAVLLATVLSACFVGCSSQPPALEEVRDRFIQLFEDSYEINDIFFGEGLPTLDRDDEENRIIYYGFFGYDAYEIVQGDCPYQSVEQIKAAAEKVYSPDYLDDIYTMAFDGYADENSDQISTARYLYAEDYFLKYSFGENDSFNILPGKRLYKYETMVIGELSSAKAVNLKIESYLEGDEQNVTTETVRFVLVDGEWYLDEPTY